MASDTDPLVLPFQNTRIRVQRHTLQGTFVYHIVFEDKRPPLVITRATDFNASKWWTSIPEGRQPEAEQIGPLITEYIQQKN